MLDFCKHCGNILKYMPDGTRKCRNGHISGVPKTRERPATSGNEISAIDKAKTVERSHTVTKTETSHVRKVKTEMNQCKMCKKFSFKPQVDLGEMEEIEELMKKGIYICSSICLVEYHLKDRLD